MEPLRPCTAWRGNSDCLACDGQEHTLFSGLKPETVPTLHAEVSNGRYANGSLMYAAGEHATDLWVLRTGAVKLLSASWDGEIRIVRVLKPGDTAGLEGLLADQYAHHAYAIGEVRVCRTPIDAVRNLCLNHAEYHWDLMRQWQAALRETEQWLLDATTTGAPARVRMARLLLRLRVGNSHRIYNFPREDLGLILGIAIETASRIIAAFVREKLLVKHHSKSNEAARYYTADIARIEAIAHGRIA